VRREIALSAARSLLAVLQGEIPQTCINP